MVPRIWLAMTAHCTRGHRCGRYPALLLVLVLMLWEPRPGNSRVVYDPAYQFVTTARCDPGDAFQLWNINTTTHRIWEHRPSPLVRCLALAPNSLDLTFPCADARLPTPTQGTSALNPPPAAAYDSHLFSKTCTERTQRLADFHGEELQDFSVLVTRDCRPAYFGEDDPMQPWLRLSSTSHGLANDWVMDKNGTGHLMNIQSGKCAQIGGSFHLQCEDIVDRDSRGHVSSVQRSSFIGPSAYPAYLFSCGVGCRPDDLQQWTTEPVDGNDSDSDSNVVGAVRIRLRFDPTLCLRAGVDEANVWSWDKNTEPWAVGGTVALLLTAAFMYESTDIARRVASRGYYDRMRLAALTRKQWDERLLFDPSVGLSAIRMTCAYSSSVLSAFFFVAWSLPLSRGGSAFYPKQISVHGMTLWITLLFVHWMLVASDPEERQDQEDNAGLDHNRRCGAAKRNCWRLARFYLLERPSLTVNFLVVWTSRIMLAANFGIRGTVETIGRQDETGTDALFNNNVVTWLLLGTTYFLVAHNISSGIATRRIADRRHLSMMGAGGRGTPAHSGAHSAEAAGVILEVGRQAHPTAQYIQAFASRWYKMVLLQWVLMVASFFAPYGPPSTYPIAGANLVFLSIVHEFLAGTIRSSTCATWANKPYVVLAVMFCVPLLLFTLWEFVGIGIGSYSNFGQKLMISGGAIGGYSNQIRGPGSIGWWWGREEFLPPVMSVACWFGISVSLIVIPWFLRFAGIRGKRAPVWLSDLLLETDGHIPVLPPGLRYHFFISKHEKHKQVALEIADALVEAGFKVWLSQYAARARMPVDKIGMQTAVRESECVLLVLTDKVFHRDRHWVTEVEVQYGLVQAKKPLIVAAPTPGKNRNQLNADLQKQEEGNGGDGVEMEFDMQRKCHSLSGCVHLKSCCEGVAPDFQPLARAIPAALDAAPWILSSTRSDGGGGSMSGKTDLTRILNVHGLVERYAVKEQARVKLMAELERQRQFGVCPASETPIGSQMRSRTVVDKGPSQKNAENFDVIEL